MQKKTFNSTSFKLVRIPLSVLITMLVVLTGITLFPLAKQAGATTAAATLPYSAVARGPYTVQGNKILGANGQQYIFRGIGRDGLEYNCSGEGPLDAQHLAYMGSGSNTSSGTYWGANTVRLPLSEGFWLNGAPGYPCTAAQYRATVKQTVDVLTTLKLNVVLDLQWSDAGRQSGQGGGAWSLPDADSVLFWQQVAPIYSGYSNVLFELFNEPHPASWSCWQAGCPVSETNYSNDCGCNKVVSYQGIGMQALVNAVRTTRASNLVLVAGMSWGYDLSQLSSYAITGSNVVYDTHPYPYDDKQPGNWDAAFGNASRTYPVISAESGEYDCGTSYMSQLTTYFDAHGIGWFAWAWALQGDSCGYPLLVTDYQGTPSSHMGQYLYARLRGYAPPPGLVSKTWYFADGRVGASYSENLTLENPDPINDCVVTLQYLSESGSPMAKSVSVVHASSLIEAVNADLNRPASSTNGVSVATIVTVNTVATPNCSGLVAKRSLNFTWQGVSSGSDVMGATQLGQHFYLGDVPTSAGSTSFITVLNPSGNASATVTVKYYVHGKLIGRVQSISVRAGQRGTIYPTGVGLPAHVAAVVTSTQLISVERSIYFNTIKAGNAGSVSGASSLIAAQSLARDWLFADGNTGTGHQEYLLIANLDASTNTTANVTITLTSGSGVSKVFKQTVGAFNQVIWNVNQYMSNSHVAVKVSAAKANIVVECEMYSH